MISGIWCDVPEDIQKLQIIINSPKLFFLCRIMIRNLSQLTTEYLLGRYHPLLLGQEGRGLMPVGVSPLGWHWYMIQKEGLNPPSLKKEKRKKKKRRKHEPDSTATKNMLSSPSITVTWWHENYLDWNINQKNVFLSEQNVPHKATSSILPITRQMIILVKKNGLKGQQGRCYNLTLHISQV